MESDKLENKILNRINTATLTSDALIYLQNILSDGKEWNIFEFGSGVSTLLYKDLISKGALLKVNSLESSLEYYDKTKQLIGNNESIYLHRAAMKKTRFFGKDLWAYDPRIVSEIGEKFGKFNLVLIDGPKSWLFGREATLYQIAPYVDSKTIILLDDACREDREKIVLSNWKKVWGDNINVEIDSSIGNGLGKISFKNARNKKWFPFTKSEKLESNVFTESVMSLN